MVDKIRRIVGVILILAGVVLIGTTIWMKYNTYKEQQVILESFKNLGEYEEDNSIEENKDNEDESTDESGLALLKIPKLKLEVAIVEGVEVEDIKYVVGHFPGTPMPGEVGNFCVAGHRTSYFGQPFKEAHKLITGDEVIINYKRNEYVYEVTESFQVTPYDTYVLDNTPEESTMTIVTCTLDSKNRFIIKGKLKE